MVHICVTYQLSQNVGECLCGMNTHRKSVDVCVTYGMWEAESIEHSPCVREIVRSIPGAVTLKFILVASYPSVQR